MRKCLAVALIVALACPILSPPRARAQFAVFDAPNWVQNLLTALRTLEAIAQRVEMVRNQIEQIQSLADQIDRMDLNLEDLGSPFFRRLFGLVRNIQRELEVTAGLVYTLRDLDRRFQELYPSHVVSEDLERDELEQMFTTIETFRGSLLATRELAGDAENAERVLEDLRQQALATEGNLQILKAQAMMLAHVGQETSKMQQQLSILTNALVVQGAHTASREARAEATFREALATSYRSAPHYDASTRIPLIPQTLPRLTLPD